MTKFALFAIASVASSAVMAAEHRSSETTRAFQYLNPCPSTGRGNGACPGYVKDHIVPLCAGGADVVGNMQWQTVLDAKIKDRSEREMCLWQRD